MYELKLPKIIKSKLIFHLDTTKVKFNHCVKLLHVEIYNFFNNYLEPSARSTNDN